MTSWVACSECGCQWGHVRRKSQACLNSMVWNNRYTRRIVSFTLTCLALYIVIFCNICVLYCQLPVVGCLWVTSVQSLIWLVLHCSVDLMYVYGLNSYLSTVQYFSLFFTLIFGCVTSSAQQTVRACVGLYAGHWPNYDCK